MGGAFLLLTIRSCFLSCFVLILCLCLERHNNQHHTTTSYNKSTTRATAKATKTSKTTTNTTIKRVSLAYDSLLFLLLALFRFCVCAWSVTTINLTQQQINKKLQQKQQKQQQYQEQAHSATVDEAQPQQNTVTQIVYVSSLV
jgi:hypothetical protein